MHLADQIENMLSKLEFIEAGDAVDCLQWWMAKNHEGVITWHDVHSEGKDLEFFRDEHGEVTLTPGQDAPMFTFSSDLARAMSLVAVGDEEESSPVYAVLQHLMDILLDYETAVGHLVVSHGMMDTAELISLDHDALLEWHVELHQGVS